MDVVARAHREVELQLAREEQQRRDAFVLALLTGSSDAAELRRESATYGIDPEREYIPFRARVHAATREGALAPHGAGARGQRRARHGARRRCVGVAAASPWRSPGLTVGIGPPAHARRAPRGVRAGEPRAADRARLRPRGRALARRPLDPARRSWSTRRSATRSSRAISSRSARWVGTGPRSRRPCARGSTTACGSTTPRSALHVHPNTLRHRLRRFEEATGASLRSATEVMELWWALERRRLVGAPRAESG